MGWSSVENPHSKKKTDKLKACSFYYEGNTWTHSDGSQEVLIETLRDGPGGVYGVLRRTNLETGRAVRMALVILTQSTPAGAFQWKAMLETDGPVECRYPKSMLSQLSSPERVSTDESEVAHIKNWRKRVQEYHTRKSPGNKLLAGDIIEFEEEVPFAVSGKQIQVRQFSVMVWGKAKRLIAMPPGSDPRFKCRLHSRIWDDRNYTVTRAGQEFLTVKNT
jgi:hypothetical protein